MADQVTAEFLTLKSLLCRDMDFDTKIAEMRVFIAGIHEVRRRDVLNHIINKKHPDGWIQRTIDCRGTLMHDAVYIGSDAIVGLLCELGGDPNVAKSYGNGESSFRSLVTDPGRRQDIPWLLDPVIFENKLITMAETMNATGHISQSDKDFVLNKAVFHSFGNLAKCIVDMGGNPDEINKWEEVIRVKAAEKGIHFQ